MKKTIALAVMLALSSISFANETPGTAPKPKVPPVKRVPPIVQPINTPTANASSNASAAVVNTTVSTAGAAAQSGSSQAANVLSVEAPRLAQAPDVISYPTAPCRVSIGASGGWFGGGIGFSGSTKDDECGLINLSVALNNLGNKPAAVQVLCLSDDAKMALEATGVKCLIKRPEQQEPVKP